MSDLPEVQRALRATEGVAHARVVWPDPEGPAHLSISFVDGADEPVVAREVLEVLRRVGHIDLDTLELLHDESEGAPERPVAMERPVFEGLALDRQELDAAVTVTLRWQGRQVSGQATGLASSRHAPRTAAEATLAALRELLPPTVRVQLEWLEAAEVGAPRERLVQAAVTVLTPAEENAHVGSALVRGDVREAAVRATLDAVNRRLGVLLHHEVVLERAS